MSAGREDVAPATGAVEDQAAFWFARERKGFSAQEEAAWVRWLAVDPRHASAFEDVETTWKGLAAIRAEPEMIALREAVLIRRRWSPGPVAIAASLAAAVVLAVALPRVWYSMPHLYTQTEARIDAAARAAMPEAQDHLTSVGETRAIALADGSVVTLDTDSAVRVVSSDRSRLVTLMRGRAFFQVAKDPTRPFIVFAGNKRVMAVGTAFDVRLDGEEVSITLREGRVRVEAPAPAAFADSGSSGAEASKTVEAADLVPGTKLDASSRSGWRLAKADMARDLAWLHGQLVFDGDRLSDAVAEINRYSARKIVLADSALANVPVSGVFNAGQVEAFAQALQSYKLARIYTRTPNTIMLVGR